VSLVRMQKVFRYPGTHETVRESFPLQRQLRPC
jgi:hypothetical protein